MFKIIKLILLAFSFLLSVSLSLAFEKTSMLPDEILFLLKRDLPGFKVAQRSDFIPYLQKRKESSNTILEGDLNQDEKVDYTILLINKKRRVFGFYSFVSNNESYSTFVLSTSSWPKDYDGRIWEIMWFKNSGVPGMSSEKYFNAPGKEYPYLSKYSEKDRKEYEAAVKKYIGLNAIEKTDMAFSDHFEDDDIFYCGTVHYFEDNKMKTEGKCD